MTGKRPEKLVHTYNLLTLGSTRQPKRGQRPHRPKRIRRDHRRDFASLGVGSKKLQTSPMRNDNFLLSNAGEIANDCLDVGRRRLERQVVQMHREQAVRGSLLL
jgi:hypothetical protein